MHSVKRNNAFGSSVVAIGVLALALGASATRAAIVFTGNNLRADTTVSDSSEFSQVVAGGAAIDRTVSSQGLGSQGAPSSASASISLGVDVARGVAGSGASSLALSAGVSGNAAFLHQTFFEVEGLSQLTVAAVFDSLGNGGHDAIVKLERMSETVDFVETILRFDLSSTPVVDFSQSLDPGFYLFTVADTLQSADPGESGSGRVDFTLRFAERGGGHVVPEPESLTLAAAALALVARCRRRHGIAGGLSCSPAPGPAHAR